MIYSKIEQIKNPLSRLVYGTPGIAIEELSDHAIECYDMAYEMGFRVFDTAYSYGYGEKNLGRWLTKSGHREDVTILDKGCNPCTKYMKPDVFCAETIRQQVSESLERLQTDHVELYLLHRDDPNKPVDEIVEVLNELQEEGKIGQFGGSNWTLERTIKANEYAKKHGLKGFTVCSPNYTYMRLIRDPWGGSVTLTGEKNQKFREWLIQNQMPVFPYSSLARGFLSGRYHSDNRKPVEECLADAPILEYYAPENVERLRRAEQVAAELSVSVSQIGIAWLMKQKMNLFPLVSPSGEKHLQDVVNGLHVDLSETQMLFLDGVKDQNIDLFTGI